MSRQYLLSQDQPASQGQNDGTGIPMSPLRDDGVSVRGSFRSVSQRSSMTDHGSAVIGTAEAHNLGPSIWAPTSMPRPSRGAFIKRKPVASARSEEQTPLDPETAAHDEPVKVSQTTAQGRAIKAFHWWWWWEIAAAVLSITSMCLIIAVLFRVQDTKLADWPWEIQPSSVISILTTISKTAMMVPIASCISQLKWRHMQLRPRPLNHLQVFDDASRGPWGSAIMAWKLPFQSFLGWALALVTIVALGIEPSAQNILDFPSRDWNVTDEDGFMAEMGKADNYFSKGFLQLPGNNFQLWVPNSDLPNFQAAILNGLSGAVFEPNHKCPGNSTRCLWPDFKSLGVCSSFHNVTEETTRNCTVKNKNDWIQNCTYTIPGRMSTDPPTLEYYNNGPTSLKDTQVYYSDYGYSQRLGQLTVVRHDSGDWPESKTPPSPEIFLADFDWCVKSYSNVSATPGTLSVGQSTSELLEFREVRGMFDRKESPLNAESVRLATADNSTEAEIMQMVREWLPRYLQNLLQGELFEQVPGRRPDKTPKPDTAMNLEFLLYNAKDLKAVTENLADTITNQIRSGSPGDNSNATMVRGKVWRTETSITVRWPWLILPAMETVITAILLVVSILMTMKSPLLKTSTTAFLAYPLSGWGADELAIQDPQSAEKLNKLAQGLEGQFEKDNGNWRFVRS